MRRAMLIGLLALPILVLPAAVLAQPAGKVDLRVEVARTQALIEDPAAFRADNAAALLRARYDELLALPPERIDMAKVDQDPQGLATSLFGLMLALDRRLAELHQAGQLSDDLCDAKRRALRGIRYLREQVLLRGAVHAPGRLYAHGKPRLAEEFTRHHWSVAPGWEGKGARDLPRTFGILCMGGSSVSAGIARSAAEDNMFSHFALGYRSEKSETIEGKTYPAGTPFIVEALIETGVIIHPLEEHYQKTVRDVIFVVRERAKQPAVDAAMDAFFARARDAVNAGKALPYDFSMGTNTGLNEALEGVGGPHDPNPSPEKIDQLGDLDAYFCSGVGAAVFGQAGVRAFPFMSRIEQGPGTGRLFESWGIDPARLTPAPSDADVSPAFLRVAEGVVVAELPKVHAMGMVVLEMYRWMDAENWQLRMPVYGLAATWLAGHLNSPHIDLVPTGITTDILRTMGPMDKAANLLTERLLAENQAFSAARGRNMTPQEMSATLRRVRDDVDGLKKWFRPAPRAIGRYRLEVKPWEGSGHTVDLTVSTGKGLRYAVTRVQRDRQGRVIAVARGTASQQDESLSAEWDSQEGLLVTGYTYKLRQDGTIVANMPGHAHVERGRRVE